MDPEGKNATTMYYIMLVDKETGNKEYLEYYDKQMQEIFTTFLYQDKQVYLSKESLLADFEVIVDDKELTDRYYFEIGYEQ